MRRALPLFVAAALALPQTTLAQGFAIAGQAGTMGVGGSAIIGLNPNINIRGSAGFVPGDPTVEVEGVDFGFEFPTFLRATLDFYPTGGGFYLSGGAFFVTRDGKISVDGSFEGEKEFGGQVYTDDEVGRLLGDFEMKEFQPYVGIGFGNPVNRSIGVNVDLGVAFGKKPDVQLRATGLVANDPEFRADLEAEEQDIRDDIPDLLRYYPVISISLSIGFGN